MKNSEREASFKSNDVTGTQKSPHQQAAILALLIFSLAIAPDYRLEFILDMGLFLFFWFTLKRINAVRMAAGFFHDEGMI